MNIRLELGGGRTWVDGVNSSQAVEKCPSVPRLAGLSGRLTISAACLHAIVPAFGCLRANALSGELGAPDKCSCFGTQVWQAV